MKLYPPHIERQLPAFTGTMLNVPFTLNAAIGRNDFNKVAIIIKSVQSNTLKVNNKTTSIINFDEKTKQWIATFDLADCEFEPVIGQYYKVQIAFVYSYLNKDEEEINEVGYYSSVGVAKYTTAPILIIQNLHNNKGTNYHEYEYTGVYRQNAPDDTPTEEAKIYDRTEKVYSYRFDIYDSYFQLYETSGDLIHNSSFDVNSYESTDTWRATKDLHHNEWYTITYSVQTMNGLNITSQEYKIIQMDTVDLNLPATLTASLNFDDGYVELALKNNKGNKNHARGDFVLVRASEEDNYVTWNQIYKFNLINELPNKVIWRDFTIQQGVKYKYAIQAYNEYDLFSNRLENLEGEILADFEDAFLFDGERQLKIRFNSKVSNFKNTLLEMKTDTIGSKYPFIFRNGNVEYKEFPIAGLLSYLSDPSELFLDVYPDVNQKRDKTQSHKENIPTSGVDLTGETIKRERDFKLSALAWLSNGEPKLFKSPTEGNYIVRLMNVSLTPEDVVGRMLHNFNATAYEVATNDFKNLKSFGFIPKDDSGIKVQMHFENINLLQTFGTITPDYGTSIPLDKGAYFLFFQNQRTSLVFDVRFLNSSKMVTVDVGNVTGEYHMPITDLPAVELIYRSGQFDDGSHILYGYYDKSLPTTKSFIARMDIEDRIEQYIGKSNIQNNLLEKLNNVRTQLGNFYYIRITRRNVEQLYANSKNNEYYYDRAFNYKYTDWNAATLYYICTKDEKNQDVWSWYNGSISKPLGENETPTYKAVLNNQILNYSDFSRNLMQQEDIDKKIEKVETAARYDEITNAGPIEYLYLGNGLIADIVYQLKTTEYSIEYTDPTIIAAKELWLKKKDEYYNALFPIYNSESNTTSSGNHNNIQYLKNAMDEAYNEYIYVLTMAVNKIKEEGYNYVL